MAKNAQQFESRPWGTFEVISEFDCVVNGRPQQIVVKKIVVHPQKRLSYQSHQLRDEHWHIAGGSGVVILNDQEQTIKAGDKIYVPIGTKHRIINNHESEHLIFIEITGGQFDEFDIQRFEDDFGR